MTGKTKGRKDAAHKDTDYIAGDCGNVQAFFQTVAVKATSVAASLLSLHADNRMTNWFR